MAGLQQAISSQTSLINSMSNKIQVYNNATLAGTLKKTTTGSVQVSIGIQPSSKLVSIPISDVNKCKVYLNGNLNACDLGEIKGYHNTWQNCRAVVTSVTKDGFYVLGSGTVGGSVVNGVSTTVSYTVEEYY